MQRSARDRRATVLLVLLHAHAARRRLIRSRSSLLWSLVYTSISKVLQGASEKIGAALVRCCPYITARDPCLWDPMHNDRKRRMQHYQDLSVRLYKCICRIERAASMSSIVITCCAHVVQLFYVYFALRTSLLSYPRAFRTSSLSYVVTQSISDNPPVFLFFFSHTSTFHLLDNKPW